MNKFIVVVFTVFVCLAATAVNAQIKKPGVFIGANLLYNLPKSNFSNSYNNGIGGELTGGVGLGKTFLMATYGTGRFVSKPGYKDMIIKPFTVGIKQFVLGKSVFVSANAGNAKVNDRTKGTLNNNFLSAIGGGLRFAGFEAGLYFNNLKTDNNSLRFTQYKFGWNVSL